MGLAGFGWSFPWEYFTPDRIVLMMIALPGGLVALRTLYKLYRFGGDRIWDIIEAFFKEERDRIAKRRAEILAHFLGATQLKAEVTGAVNVHDTLDEAVRLFDAGRTKDKLKAEAVLTDLADTLLAKAKMADDRAQLARQQAATALLLKGTIAKSRGDKTTAIHMFEQVLSIHPRDPDAVKFLGLLTPTHALGRFRELEQIAIETGNIALQAEALRYKAEALGDGQNSKDALSDAVALEERREPKDLLVLGETYRRWAEVSAKVDGVKGVPKNAIERFRKAADYFENGGDTKAAIAARGRAEGLSTAPSPQTNGLSP